jgi:hypothetical protein
MDMSSMEENQVV